jgi:hypothetical protein
MTGAGGERRRRWDAGQVIVTDRDLTALRFVGEQYGVRDDALRVLLTRLSPAAGRLSPGQVLSPRTARVWVERMERSGWLIRRRLLGHVWTTPTAAGLELAGLDYERWAFGGAHRDGAEGWGLAHVHAVAVVRLFLQGHPADGCWLSERAIRRKWEGTGARVRRADGALRLDDGRLAGVEVELHRKKPDRYEPILRDVDPDLDEVWWYTRRVDVAWLQRTLAAIPQPPRPLLRVLELPGNAS